MNPINVIKLKVLYFFKKKFSILEKDNNPTRQPSIKIRMNNKLFNCKGLCKRDKIKSYFPSMIKIKEPLIPGNIMAQIAIAPLMKIFKKLLALFMG